MISYFMDSFPVFLCIQSPVDPSVDFEYLAEQTHGYSGADIGGIAKVAAKLAIRSTIANQVARLKAIEAGDIDEDEEEEDAVPMITMEMLRRSLKESKRSVTPAEYQKYLSMKVQFDREAGVIEDQSGNQSNPSQPAPMMVPPSGSAQQPSLNDDDDEDDDDIYD